MNSNPWIGREPSSVRTSILVRTCLMSSASIALAAHWRSAPPGGHNLLFVGPPGTGKTLLASRLPGILPPMDETEALEAAAIASVAGLGLDPENWRQRRFRTPHHTASGGSAGRGWLKTENRVRFHLPMPACCFSMNCPNTAAMCWKYCVNRWNRGELSFPGPPCKPNSRPAFNSSPR